MKLHTHVAQHLYSPLTSFEGSVNNGLGVIKVLVKALIFNAKEAIKISQE
jgi:hypothetical protein